MKLYLAPGACSLSEHIALHEAGMRFDRVTVDLRTRRTDDGGDYNQVNPKGYVPALELDDGQLLTENVAILDWIGHQLPDARAAGRTWRTAACWRCSPSSPPRSTSSSAASFFPTAMPSATPRFEKIDKRLAYIAAGSRATTCSAPT
jgi:glutathione S-transferase